MLLFPAVNKAKLLKFALKQPSFRDLSANVSYQY